MTIDSQLASDLLLGLIALMGVVGLVATVGAMFSMGRQAYRKD
ncbi:hypothetical protein ACFQZV_06925 [Microbacterium koreense]|uniref:Uncharacterized protein n=1 Tax=Microbacterium koreense TaxID=323761 RepID=A0ABW2ZR63_9MICO